MIPNQPEMLLRISFILLFILIPILVFLLAPSGNFSLHSLYSWKDHLTAFCSVNQAAATLLFFLLSVMASLITLPVGVFIKVLAGILFEIPLALFLVTTGIIVGSTLSFIMGRVLFYDWILGRYQWQRGRLAPYFSRNLLWHLFLLRVLPILPLNVTNLLMSVTEIKLGHFVGVSFLGMFPATVFYVYVGSRFRKNQFYLPDLWSFWIFLFLIFILGFFYRRQHGKGWGGERKL